MVKAISSWIITRIIIYSSLTVIDDITLQIPDKMDTKGISLQWRHMSAGSAEFPSQPASNADSVSQP